MKLSGRLAIGVLLAIAIFAGCTNPLAPEEGALRIVFNDMVSKTIVPAISMEPASYEVSGAGPLDASFSKSVQAGETLELPRIYAGSWTITAVAKNAAGVAIGQGVGTVEILTNQTSNLNITIKPYEGFGSLSLTMTWPAGKIRDARVEASLTSAAGTVMPLDFVVNGTDGTATCSVSAVATGYHTMVLKLFDGIHLAAGAVEVVRIVKGQPTVGTIAFADVNPAKGNLIVSMTPEMADPLSVSIRGAGTSKFTMLAMPLTASVADFQAGIVYVWYVNGEAKGADESFLFDSSWETGIYRIDVTAFAADGSRAGSANAIVSVVEPGENTFVYTDAEPFFKVDFRGQAVISLNVRNANGKRLVLVKSNGTRQVVAADQTGSVDLSGVSLIPLAPAESTSVGPVFFREEHSSAEDFNREAIEGHYAARSEDGNRSIRNLEPSQTLAYGEEPALEEGISTRTFWTDDGKQNFVEESATLRAIGRYCYVWVVDSNFADDSAANNDNKITSAQAKAIQAKFDGTEANDYADGIFKNVTNIFGYEFGGGEGGDGGRDGDQRVVILIHDAKKDFTPGQTGGVFGYFWSKDFFSQQELDQMGYSWLKTNYMEVFYLDAHFSDLSPNQAFSTLAHEYQHMIHFNEKAVLRNLGSETWFNEMCSMVTEDLILANIGIDPVRYGAQSRFREYSYHYAQSGIVDWHRTGYDTYKSYASAFAFGAFLARNYGGAAIFKELASNNYTNEAAVAAAVSTLGYTDTFAATLGKYAQALVYTVVPAGSSVCTLNRQADATIDGVAYRALPINLDSVRQIDLDNLRYTGKYGMRYYAIDELVPLRPMGFAMYGPEQALASDDVTVTLNAPTANGVTFYLMFR
jgi:hypothetical protein